MKKFLIFLGLILTTYNSISQTVTGINKDSVICLPKKYVLSMIEDIEKGDLCSEEIKILDKNINLYKTTISIKDSIIYQFNQKDSLYKINEFNYQKIIENNNKQLSLYNKNIKSLKLKSTLLGLGVFVGPIIILMLK